MTCLACGQSFEAQALLEAHQAETGHLGQTSRSQERRAGERRKQHDRRTHAGRFALYIGHGRRQMLPNPELIILTRCPERLKDDWLTLRTQIDIFMVNLAEEVAKRDHITSTGTGKNQPFRRGSKT